VVWESGFVDADAFDRWRCHGVLERVIMKRDFDKEASTWDQNEARLRMGLQIAEAMAAWLQLAGQETLVDYGTGTGVIALKLAPAAKQVICVDSSRGMLDVLDGKIRAANLQHVRSLLLDLEQPNDSSLPPLDVLVSSLALHHIVDTAAIARRFFSVLRSGGRLAVADLDSEAGDFHTDNTGVAHFGFDRQEVERIFREAGFAGVTTTTATTTTKQTAAGIQKQFSIFLLTATRP
jgi:ubiquinone/menaquinone biosynthesis C-methylase UbiE